MSYFPVGQLRAGELTRSGTTAPQPGVTATSPTTESLLSRCPSGQEYHTLLKKCVPRCPSGQSYNLMQGKCVTSRVACDKSKDQVYDPRTGKCFDPQTMPIPWDDAAHPFWAMQLQDRHGRWRKRGDMKHICKDYMNSPMHYPTLIPVSSGSPLSNEGVWMCRSQRAPRTPGATKTPTPATMRCMDLACATENCKAAESSGLIPPGYASICAQWMMANMGTGACVTETVINSEGGVQQVQHRTNTCRVSDFVTYLNNLPPEQKAAVDQAVLNEQAVQRNKKLLLIGGIGFAALAGVILLKKRKS